MHHLRQLVLTNHVQFFLVWTLLTELMPSGVRISALIHAIAVFVSNSPPLTGNMKALTLWIAVRPSLPRASARWCAHVPQPWQHRRRHCEQHVDKMRFRGEHEG